MYNELLKIGDFTLYSYGLMMGLGIICAILLTEYRAGRNGLKADAIFYLAVWGVIGGFAGSKLLYFITELPQIIKNPSIILNFSQGFVVYGAIIGGIAGGAIYLRIAGLPFLPYFDLVMPSVALAQGIGRIGCFLAGCCYGRETDAWYGIVFPHSDIAPEGVKLIPTQLFSSILDFFHFGILIVIGRKAKKNGIVGACYLLFYGLGRFAVEQLRDDPRGNIGFLSTSQFISLFWIFIGAGLLLWTKIKGSTIQKQV